MRSRKVLIVNQYAGSPYHGMEFRHYYLSKELQKRGFLVEIVSGTFSHLFHRLPIGSAPLNREEIDGISYWWLRVPRYTKVAGLWRFASMCVFAIRLLALIPRVRSRPEVIIVSSPSPFAVVTGMLLRVFWRAKFILEVRDLWPLTLVELGGLRPGHPLVILLRFIEVLAYTFSDAVVSVLPRAKSYMMRNGLRADRYFHVPNGIDAVSTERQAATTHCPPSSRCEGKFTIGYTGTLGRANAMRTVVEAAALLSGDSSIRFVIVGEGEERPYLEKLAATKGVRSMEFTGRIAKNLLQGVLAGFDVCLVSMLDSKMYRHGTSLNKVFEYMYAAKPVVEATPEKDSVIAKAGCGISVPAEDPIALASAILVLARMDRTTLDRMGERGREYVIEHHSYEALGRDYARLLDRLVGGR